MFVIDDLLLRSVGISVPGLDLIWTLEQIRGYAQRELYNPERIRNQIKEIRLLYEFGELSHEEYLERTEQLMQRLRIAEELQR
ncbi:MAG: gas vesicle protein GvpG [Methanothrix sp.]|uniref:gas vesicle protein GvpG n=1 Tax=Methanothrix sp. TaxID=90426 RepID=UPI0025DA0C9E|nr:gas vesicle protein GvpG [Methanothrix sp.]MCQ8902533.1 gas vesicle protein GvpG [Methanothrix sp.]